ncbi:MAG: ion transporter [Gammaproteobacteria bacterium]|nr:ion transporter [Gammaproteobacteria bacterium]
MKQIKSIVESLWFHNFIITVIVINGVVLGIETIRDLDPTFLQILIAIDRICLGIFVIELLMKLMVYRLFFFKQGWNIFDFVIVAVALIPATGQLSILRAFRIFRVLRLITTVDSIRRVVAGMLIAIPGVGSVGALLMIFFYIGAVISTTLFGELFPDWFGNIGRSMYSLFQIMTLESWSMGIVRPVMEEFPYAWIFFIPFIMVTTFMVLNLFIGIIVDAIATVKEQDNSDRNHQISSKEDIDLIRRDIALLQDKLDHLLNDPNAEVPLDKSK